MRQAQPDKVRFYRGAMRVMQPPAPVRSLRIGIPPRCHRPPPPWLSSSHAPLSGGLDRKWRRAAIAYDLDRIEQRFRSCDRTENAALRLDHGESGLVKFRKIRGAAVRQHDAAEAAIVGFAHGSVDADLGGHPGDE